MTYSNNIVYVVHCSMFSLCFFLAKCSIKFIAICPLDRAWLNIRVSTENMVNPYIGIGLPIGVIELGTSASQYCFRTLKGLFHPDIHPWFIYIYHIVVTLLPGTGTLFRNMALLLLTIINVKMTYFAGNIDRMSVSNQHICFCINIACSVKWQRSITETGKYNHMSCIWYYISAQSLCLQTLECAFVVEKKKLQYKVVYIVI